MRKSKKLQPEPFDVGDFLRPTDTDLRSALNSLLHGNPTEAEVTLRGGLSLVGDQESIATLIESEVELRADVSLGWEVNLTPAIPASPSESSPPVDSGPGASLTTAVPLSPPPRARMVPAVVLPSAPILQAAPIAGSGLSLPSAPHKRQFAVRPAHLVEDGHSRAEQQVYAQLWENATSFDEVSRLITLGFASMGRLTGLSESNARINLRSLIQKLAVAEHTTYDCATSQGRTYRIYQPAEILRRRHQAGFSWVMRRTLAVVFVDPQTKLPLFVKTGSLSGPGLNLVSSLILTNAVRGHLQQYGPTSEDQVHQLIDACPGVSPEQIAQAIHHQALLTQGLSPQQTIAHLLETVPQSVGQASWPLPAR